MSGPRTIERVSRLTAPHDVVWKAATAMRTINREMGPWLKMTFPAEASGMSLDDPSVRLGEVLFPSWILFLGIFPVERMQVTIVELERAPSREASRAFWFAEPRTTIARPCRDVIALHAQDGSFLTESAEASDLESGELRVTPDTKFVENGSKIGNDIVPLPSDPLK